MIQSSSNLMRLLTEFAARQLEMAQDQLLLIGKGSAEEKAAIFLINWRSRLARLAAFSESTPLPMPRQDIADYLGLTLETIVARSPNSSKGTRFESFRKESY